MKATIQPNTITNRKTYLEGGTIIAFEDGARSGYFTVAGKIKVFGLDETFKHGIRARIANGTLGTSISAIQYNVVCNEIKNEINTK